jgi:hypothetical protein
MLRNRQRPHMRETLAKIKITTMTQTLFYSIGLIITMISCAKEKTDSIDKYYDLPKDKQFVYEVGDTLVYTDYQNDKDSFVIYNMITDYRKVKDEYYTQFQRIYYKQLDAISEQGQAIKLERDFFEISWVNGGVIYYLGGIVDTSSFYIGEVLFEDAYNFEDRLVFNYRYGILKYKKYSRDYELILF